MGRTRTVAGSSNAGLTRLIYAKAEAWSVDLYAQQAALAGRQREPMCGASVIRALLQGSKCGVVHAVGRRNLHRPVGAREWQMRPNPPSCEADPSDLWVVTYTSRYVKFQNCMGSGAYGGQ